MNNSNSNVLDEDTKRTTGPNAIVSNIEAAKAVASIVKTTLGPMGMDKMLIDSVGDSIITNDGVKILKEMEIEHPGAKLLVEVAKTQDLEVGDGTTTAVILVGEMLKSAQELLEKKIHPTTITRTYKKAQEKALSILKKEAIHVDPNNKILIKDICETAMTGKVAEFSKEKLSELIYTITKQIQEKNSIDISRIKIQKVSGGEIEESSLIEGIVLDKNIANPNMPKSLRNARILLFSNPLETRELDSDAKVNIGSLQEYEEFIKGEENYLSTIVDKIIESGTNVIICQKGIDDNVAYQLAKNNILAVRRTRKSDLEKLSYALNTNIISAINDIRTENVSIAKEVNVRKILNENYIFIEGCENPKAVTLLLKSSTNHILDELGRAIEDALGDVNSVLKSQQIVAGGGAIELELYKQLNEYAKEFHGIEQLIIEAYSKSFLSIPKILCENSGFDELETITKLISHHEKGKSKSGINSFEGVVLDTIKRKIVEPINIKSQAIKSATESSSMILRIDDIIAAKKINNDHSED